MSLSFSRALVTGSTGFIGTALASRLKQEGIEVHELALPGGDITEKDSLDSVLQKIRPEIVFHLAAYGTFGNEKDVDRMIDVNIQGTYNLLHGSIVHGTKAFIMAGSAKEYATARTPISEESVLKPWDNYAATKSSAEYFCSLAAPQYKIPVTTLRLSPVYGPGDSLTRFVSVAIKAALTGTVFTLSTGDIVRNFTYIDDVVGMFLRAAGRNTGGYEAYNVASALPYSFQDVLHAIEKATGKTINIQIVSPTSANDDSWVLTPTKAKEQLGWEAKVSLEEGIARTVEWYTETQL